MQTEKAPLPAPKSLHIIGIDIGAKDIHISTPSEEPPNLWWVYHFKLDDPLWWKMFTNILANGCLVAAEPTGWHYMAPIFNILNSYIPDCKLYLVNHSTTADTRRLHISNSKTDPMDARALAFIAREIAAGRPPRNTRIHNPTLEAQVIDLRLSLNERERYKKASVKTTNQIRQLAHSAFPLLNVKLSTYLNCIKEGAITPNEIKALIASDPQINHRKLHHMKKLAAALPSINVPGTLRENIRKLVDQQLLNEAALAAIESYLIYQIDQPPINEVTRRWRTIPRSSPIAIAALHVVTAGQAENFTPDSLKAAIGVSPKSKRSGSIDQTRMSKGGYRPAMNAIWTWTMMLVSNQAPANDVRRYYQQKKQTNQRAFYAARSKLVRIISGVARSPEGYHYQEKNQ